MCWRSRRTWQGERGHITRELLEPHMPAALRGRLHYFLCGPTPTTRAAEAALREFGVPAPQLHTELFELVQGRARCAERTLFVCRC